jgi:hypothetical protein
MAHDLEASDLTTQLFEEETELAKEVAVLDGLLRIGHGSR